MLHNNEQCHWKETDGCGKLAHRQTPAFSRWCGECRQSGECAAFTGLQRCGLPRSPSPLNTLPAYTAPSGNAWRTSATPYCLSPSTLHSSTAPSDPVWRIPATTYRLSLLEHKKIATRFRMTTFHPLFFLTAIQNMIPTLTQTITFSFLFYSGFHPDIFPKIPAYSLPAVEYFQE